jgi:nicotinate phosphoribosyltransferase
MAHSYIEAFAGEEEAFRAFAQDFPGRATFLVDTYDTIAGIKHAINVIKELRLTGRLGIRIDSGDLVALSRRARGLLDQAGLKDVRIFASGGLDELSIDKLVRDGALIDAFGVGTRMGVSADHPYLDTAYKLVCYEGRPVMKLSRGKVSEPGRKQVFRRSRPFGDLIGLDDEEVPPGRERLLEPVVLGGVRSGPQSSIAQAKARFAADLAHLPAAALNINAPRAPVARSTAALRAMTLETRRRLVAGHRQTH